MAKVKLDLQNKTDSALDEFATKHETAMAGNANFTTPVPTATVFGATRGAFSAKLAEIAAKEINLQTLRAERDALRAALETDLNERGGYVDQESGGDEAKILSSGFQVQAAASTTTSIDAPYNVASTMGDNAGEIDLSCHAVPKAKSYIIEMREHSDTTAPGPWAMAKVASRSSATISGLTTGKKYAFRMRALGPNDLESPWSDETVCLAP